LTIQKTFDVILTKQNDQSKIIVEMTNKKFQPELGQKVHSPITMDKFKMTCPK
jgi:hypothetical protein